MTFKDRLKSFILLSRTDWSSERGSELTSEEAAEYEHHCAVLCCMPEMMMTDDDDIESLRMPTY